MSIESIVIYLFFLLMLVTFCSFSDPSSYWSLQRTRFQFHWIFFYIFNFYYIDLCFYPYHFFPSLPQCLICSYIDLCILNNILCNILMIPMCLNISKPKPIKRKVFYKAIIYFRFNSLCILVILNSLSSYSLEDKLFAMRRKVNSPTNNIM